MTGEDRIEIQNIIKGLWKFTTDEQIMSVMFAADCYEKAAVLRVVDAVAGKHEKPDCPVAKLRTALSKLPRPVAHVTPVYALSASGHHFTNNYTTPDFEYAKRLMVDDLGREPKGVIITYGWDEKPEDFALYGDFDQFLKVRAPLIANMKPKGKGIAKPIPQDKDLGTELAKQKQALYDETDDPEQKAKLKRFGYNKRTETGANAIVSSEHGEGSASTISQIGAELVEKIKDNPKMFGA